MPVSRYSRLLTVRQAASVKALLPQKFQHLTMFGLQTLSSTTPSDHTTTLTCGDKNLSEYTSARWLWKENEQLQRRRVSFNVTELAKVAAKATGANSCVTLTKLPEGNFNKVFLMVMEDGKEVVAKLPNPNAGRPHLTTASEVATMDYVCVSS